MSSSVAKGAGALVIGRYGVAVLGWAGTLVLVRVLSPNAWGEYSLIFSIMGLIGSFADLKLGRVVIRDLQDAGDRLEGTLGSFVTLRLVVGFASYVAALVVVWVGGYPPIVLEAMAVSAAVLIVAAAGSAMSVFFSSQMWMRAAAGADVVAQATQLVLTIGLAIAGYRDLVLFTLPAVLFEFVSLGALLRATRGMVRVRLRLDMTRWRSWLKDAAVLSIGATLGAVYMEIDTVMLSQLSNLPAVGVYAVGTKFATLAGVISAAVSASLLVSMTKNWPGNPDAVVAAFRRTMLLLFATGTAVALEFFAFSAPVIGLLYGRHYVAGSAAAERLVLAEVLTYFSELCFVTLVAMGRNLPYVLAAGVGVVLNVGLNLLLIPRWSYNGASVATVATEAVVLVILGVVLWRRHGTGSGEWIPRRGMVKVCVAGAAMATVAFSLRGHVPWEVAAAAAAGVYLAVLHLARVDGPTGLRALAQ